MTVTITAFADSPDKGQGLARDMRVRWALEEVGQPYAVRLLSFAEMKQPAHRALQPFGQIPSYEEDGLVLFETGAIVLHIAQTRAGLLPDDSIGRARAIAWLFAALNTIEPPVIEREAAMLTEGDKSWFAERGRMIDDHIRARLADLAAWLGDAEWLDGDFSAGDLMMAMVLLRLKGSDVLADFLTLAAYLERGEARPAYQRAFAAQHEVYLATL